MQTTITGRHMELTDALREHIEKKIARIGKYYDRISELDVVVAAEGINHRVEIIARVDSHQPFVVNDAGQDAYGCLDSAMDKIERQLTKHKEKIRNRKGRQGASEATADIIEAQLTEEEPEE